LQLKNTLLTNELNNQWLNDEYNKSLIIFYLLTNELNFRWLNDEYNHSWIIHYLLTNELTFSDLMMTKIAVGQFLFID